MNIMGFLKADEVKEIFREGKMLSMLEHRNIINLHHAFLYKKDFIMIMEYASGGELGSFVNKTNGVSETIA